MILLMKCLNEEPRVKRCISNFHDEPFCEKIIVIDGGSTDLTVHELKRFSKVSVYEHKWLFDYHDNEVSQSNIALSYVPNGELLMIMDFDEVMSPELIALLQDIHVGNVGVDEGVAVHFSRKTWEVVRYTNSPHAIIGEDNYPLKSHQIGQYPDYQCRMFRKSYKLHWVSSPHHYLDGHTSEAFFDADITHYEKDDYRDRWRLEIQWARAQARREELGLPADIFETKPKPEIAEFYDSDTWR